MVQYITAITEFFMSPFGRIIVRVICVTVFGGGAYFFIMKVSDLLELFAKPKKKIIIQAIAEIFAYVIIILLSLGAGFIYASAGQKLSTVIIESVLYGFGSLAILNFILSGSFYKLLKFIFRRKSK